MNQANETGGTKEIYEEFLQNVGEIVNGRIEDLSETTMYVPAREFANSVFKEVGDGAAVEAVVDAINVQESSVREALKAELKFFNAKHIDVEVTARAFEDAETVKGSLEDILGSAFPGWLKKMFKILNELLSLLKPL